MPVVTLTTDIPADFWLPDILGYTQTDLADFGAGGSVTVASTATSVTISNPASLYGSVEITLAGTGFAYGAGGPVAGFVQSFTLRVDGWIWMSVTGLSVELQDIDHWMFGWNRNGVWRAGDGYDLMSLLMAGSDTINGTAGDDELIPGSNRGNDVIYAGAGDDFIRAEAGNDTIFGGDGFDIYSQRESFWDASAFRGANVNLATGVAIDAWGGTDTISGIEQVRGSRLSDRFTGSGADEQFMGLRGNDTINGASGMDLVRYDRDADFGGMGGVRVNLGTGTGVDGWGNTDRLSGIEGVVGSRNGDVLTGDGADNFFVGGAGRDTISGGQGSDTAEFWNDGMTAPGIVVNLGRTTGQVVNDGYGNTETLVSIENIWGSSLADQITGSGAANHLGGDAGVDTIVGGGGNDTIVGGSGADRLTGGTGADQFVFNRADGGTPWGDTITDFTSGTDDLVFATADFAGMAGTLQFRNGASAVGTGSQFYFNTATKQLFWDADGTGAGAAVLVATLSGVASLTAGDFVLG